MELGCPHGWLQDPCPAHSAGTARSQPGEAELICKGMFSPTPLPALPTPGLTQGTLACNVSFLRSSSSQFLQSWDSPGTPLGAELSSLFPVG